MEPSVTTLMLLGFWAVGRGGGFNAGRFSIMDRCWTEHSNKIALEIWRDLGMRGLLA